MTEGERHDTIVAVAERVITLEQQYRDTSEDPPEHRSVYVLLKEARAALRKACLPIESSEPIKYIKPPYETLLSVEAVQSAYWGVPGQVDGLRNVGAATLEAMATKLEREGYPIAAGRCRDIAVKERAI